MACLSIGGNRYVPDFFWQKGTLMNPETLLHMAAEYLTAEAVKGPGTMFLAKGSAGLIVTRTPDPNRQLLLITKFDCDDFRKGLSSNQWARLLKDIWNAHQTRQEGDASATNN